MLTLDVEMPIEEALRKAMEQAIANGSNLYQIARSAGVDYAALKRWYDDKDRDIRVSTAASLMRYFRLKIVEEAAGDQLPARKSPPRKKPPTK